MDLKIVSAGGKITALILFFCALLVIPVGFGMLFSYPDSIWWLGLLLLACGFIFITSGIAGLKRSAKEDEEAGDEIKMIANQLKKIQQQTVNVIPAVQNDNTGVVQDVKQQQEAFNPVTSSIINNEAQILARWIYTDDEWKKFVAWEIKERRSNTTVEAVLIIVLGTIFLELFKSASLWLSLLISGFIAIIYWVGKYFLSMASIGKAMGKANEVIVTQSAVIINGKYNAFRSKMYSLKNIEMIEGSSPKVMEIVYQWNTRNGTTHDEIRIPIPEGKFEEAIDVAMFLRGY